MTMVKLPYLAENYEERLAVCRTCPFLVNGKKCAKCGCSVRLKAKFKSCKCPVGKWDQTIPEVENNGGAN